MTANPSGLWLTAIVALIGLGISAAVVALAARRHVSLKRAVTVVATTASGTATPSAAEPVENDTDRPAIVEQLDSVEKLTTQQLAHLLITMADSREWQALGRQFDSLFEQRLTHLRALAACPPNNISRGQALRHTFEAFRISRLIMALYDELVAKSDVVAEVLNGWFVANRGMTVSEFGANVNFDCAHILLMDLDYARPTSETTLAQLRLAEKFCHSACSADRDCSRSPRTLLSEIERRKQRAQTSAVAQ